MTINFAELFEEALRKLEDRPGTIVKGTVVSIDKDVVLVKAGQRYESCIPIDQFRDSEGRVNLKVGDEVDVFQMGLETSFFLEKKRKGMRLGSI